MSFCPNCRSPLEPAARFCANCGHTLPAGPQPAGPRPFAGAPPGYGPAPAAPTPPQYGGGYGGAPPGAPGGYGAPPGAPGGYGAPPQPPAPGGYGAPPGGYAPMPGAMPPGAPTAAPAQAEGGGMKILGGCGIAGCLGAGIALVLGVVMVGFLIMLGSGSSSSSSPPTSGGGSGEVPSSGSVRDLIRSNVGVYSLLSTAPLDKVPPGVIDSVGAIYTAPDGSRVVHVLLVYPSEAVARSRIEGVFSSSIDELKSGQKVNRGTVTDSSGAQTGIIVAVSGRNPESVFWSNRKLVVIVSANAPHAIGFEKSAPY